MSYLLFKVPSSFKKKNVITQWPALIGTQCKLNIYTYCSAFSFPIGCPWCHLHIELPCPLSAAFFAPSKCHVSRQPPGL